MPLEPSNNGSLQLYEHRPARTCFDVRNTMLYGFFDLAQGFSNFPYSQQLPKQSATGL